MEYYEWIKNALGWGWQRGCARFQDWILSDPAALQADSPVATVEQGHNNMGSIAFAFIPPVGSCGNHKEM